MAKYVPLVTFKIKGKHHICDVLDDIEDAFNKGVKYGYHETYISKNGGAVVFSLSSDDACSQLLKHLETLRGEKLESFSVFPFEGLLNDGKVEKLNGNSPEEIERLKSKN